MKDTQQRRIGWHWLWFLPYCLAVLLVVEGHTVPHCFSVAVLAYHRWVWAALFSPSAYVCLSAMCISVVWPLYGLWLIGIALTAAEELQKPQRRPLYVVLLALGILLFPCITDALIWGSFPFTIDDAGVSRLRMIPFIPWPEGRFGEF